MKKFVWIIAALVTAILAGCAHPLWQFAPPPPNRPQVSVIDGKYIIVSPEPLVFRAGGEPVDIEWQLPADSRFTFPRKDGVTVDSRQTEKNSPMMRVTKDQFDCELKENTGGKAFRCRNFKIKGIYRYTIRVNDGTTSLPPLDPYMMNN